MADAARAAMEAVENKLNYEIGFGWWKRYVASAFWSNVSAPINLGITLMTALMTARSTGAAAAVPAAGLSIATLVLSVVNTFLRPHMQMTENVKLMARWAELGAQFEAIYFSDKATADDVARRLAGYRALQSTMNAFRADGAPDHQSYVTDLIHVVARAACLRNNDHWVEPETVEEPIVITPPAIGHTQVGVERNDARVYRVSNNSGTPTCPQLLAAGPSDGGGEKGT